MKLLKIQNFDKNFRFFLPLTLIFFVAFVGIASFFIYNSPHDYQQGNAVKIMYIHVPAAWLALLIYTLVAIFNLCYFIYRNNFFALIARAIAGIGCGFTLITLITGSIWGKPIWGTWWVWDARLTSVLFLFFLYVGYILIYDNLWQEKNGEKLAAIVAIVGFINVPIIKFSVEYWNSLHQPASIIRSGGIAIHNSLLVPLLLTFATYFCYFIILALLNTKNLILIKKINNHDLHRYR
jgi:heme exporter protein C